MSTHDLPTEQPPDPADIHALPAVARKIVERLGMTKIPHEGAWFVQTYVSGDDFDGSMAGQYRGQRVAASGIYTLLTPACFSALHRLDTDEIWHFYSGTPVELYMLSDNQGRTCITLGSDVLAGHHPQYVVPRGTWMAARPVDDGPEAWSLLGNTLAPGFSYEAYEPGIRDSLIDRFPDQLAHIVSFTRESE